MFKRTLKVIPSYSLRVDGFIAEADHRSPSARLPDHTHDEGEALHTHKLYKEETCKKTPFDSCEW